MTLGREAGVSNHQNAPSGLKKLVDSIDLERNRVIEQPIADRDEVPLSSA
jgi:hypothetical protein